MHKKTELKREYWTAEQGISNFEGKITEISNRKSKIELIIGDNGIGLPKEFDFRNTKTLGLDLVNSLTDQIDGAIELDRSKGTEFKITFEA